MGKRAIFHCAYILFPISSCLEFYHAALQHDYSVVMLLHNKASDHLVKLFNVELVE